MAEQHHGRHYPYERLAVEGKDRQEEDRVGMKMEGVEIIMAEDGVEEPEKGGTSPAKTMCKKKG